MSLSSQAARGGAITLGSQGVKLVVMLGSTIILARLLDPVDYGLMAMIVALVGIAEVVRDFGLSMAALQAEELSQQQHSNLMWLNVAVGAGLTTVVFFSAPAISSFYGEPRLVPLVEALSVVYVIGGCSTQFKVAINRELRFGALAVADLGPYLLGFVVAISGAWAGWGVWALVVMQIVTAAATLVLSASLAGWWPSLPGRAPMRELVTFGTSLVATQVISYVTRNVDSIGIGRIAGPTALGYYDRAYQLMIMPLNQVNAPMTRIAVPVLSRLRREPERLLHYLRRAQLVALYVTCTVFGLAIAFGPQLVDILLGAKWERTGVLLQILALGGVFRSLGQVSWWMYVSQGKAGAQLRFFLVAQPLLVLTILAGLPWGATGVAWGHSIGFAVYWVASLTWAGRTVGLPTRPMFSDAARAVGLFAAPGVLAGWLTVQLLPDTWASVLLLAVGLLPSIIWWAGVGLLVPAVRRDLAALVGFARSALGRNRAPALDPEPDDAA